MKLFFKNKLLILMALPMLILSLIGVAPAYAATTEYDLDASGTYNFMSGDPAMDIATGLTATSNPAGGTMDGARVVIGTGFQSGDTLSVTDSGGVTSSYNSNSGVLTLSGTANVSVYQTVLQSVKFSTTSTTTGQRTITYSLGQAVPFDGNGHYYIFISNPLITWTAAKAAAEASSYFGFQGYLATIGGAGANENAFATDKLNGQGAWLGGSDAAVEGQWRWVTGPEAGTLFCTDTLLGQGGCSDGGQYDNWADTQPDNYWIDGSPEHYLQFQAGQNGKWNDLPNTGFTADWIQGYVVEYGGMLGDTPMDISGSVTVDVAVNRTVTFDANGGTGSMSNQVAYVPTALTTNAFTRTNYSFSGWSTVADGSGTYYANGETYNFTADVTLYAQWLDTIAPVGSIDDGPFSHDSSSSASFTFSATDNITVSPNFSFWCRLDGGTWEKCNSGTKSYTGLSDGSHIFEMDAYDEADNVADRQSYTWTVDTIAPVASINTKPANPTPITSASFTFSATDNLTVAPDFDYYCRLDDGDWEACDSGSKSYTNLSLGSHTFELDALDEAKNNAARLSYTWTVNAVPTFQDVTGSYWAWQFIERLYTAGITGGCTTSPLNYCPDSLVTRAQMAVFLLKSIHGTSYVPPAVGASTGFTDVATTHWAAAWIKQLAAEKVTGGCGIGTTYCPDNSVTRAEMAVFLLKATRGTSYIPPAVGSGTGFTDVLSDYWAAPWIKQLAAEGITGGCAAGVYCPESSVTRAQMAVFLVKAFNLP